MEEPKQTYTEKENLVFAAQLLNKKTPAKEVETALVERGVGAITANQMVEQLITQQKKTQRINGIRNLVIGIFLMIAGAYVALTTQVADKASTIVVSVAAFLYGVATAVQGGLQLRRK